MSFEMDAFTDRLCRFRSTAGEVAPAADWLADRLDALGFETYGWDADADLLSAHSSFPDDPDAIDVDGRRSVAGVIEVGNVDGAGNPDAVPTVVLNGHLDVVPAEPDGWSSDPFEPTWRAGEAAADGAGGKTADGAGGKTADGVDGPSSDADGRTLTARGAADMKAGLAACVGAALDVRESAESGQFTPPAGGLRIVVEAVAGEEDGGYGLATATLSDPYPFERDAAIVAEPTDLRPVVACEGCLMMELRLEGRSAHAAARWQGEDVLPRFERIRGAFMALERERAESVTHPQYGEFPVPWPVVCGTVEAGSWPSTVPAALRAGFRIGVAPGETVAEVERAFVDRLETVAADDPWLRDHPPEFERFSVQFEPSEVPDDDPIVDAVRAGRLETGLPDAEPIGATYGTDARHYIEAGIPAVVFGPGDINEAHYPDETIEWADVETGRAAIAAAVRQFAADQGPSSGAPADGASAR